jgi:hypothetical protein
MTRLIKWGAAALVCGVFIGWCVNVAHAEQATTAQAKGTITGVAMYDGQPVNGATVRLVQPVRAGQEPRKAARALATEPAKRGKAAKGDKAARAARPAAKQQPVATATTDDDGKFTFNEVEPGDYVVAIALRGRANGRARVHVVAGKTSTVSIEMRERPAGTRKNKAPL